MPSIRKQRILNDGLKAATVLLFGCGWLFLTLGVHAQKGLPTSKPEGYVNDYAGVLSQSARDQLTALCTEVDQKAHAQISVVTVKSLDGRPIADYTVDLFTKWGLGPKQSNQGVLILVSPQDRQYWTTVGYGLEPILPDGKVGGFGREAIPYLRDGNYDAALLLMTRRVADVIARDRRITLSATTSIPPARIPGRTQGNGPSPIATIIFLIFILSLLASLFRRGGGRGGRGGGSGWWIGPMIGGMMGGGGGFGGGGFGGGGGGGGFGGFGGGATGGGGAGGSW